MTRRSGSDVHRLVGAGDLHSSPLVDQLHRGRTPLARRAAALRIDHDQRGQAGDSSICLATVAPSSTFSKRTVPAYSVMIGR
jgi:hypothetical protein